ncbi:hypothetical protein [Shinella sp.]|uniref:hypothetical protein n=1 Tax=Shinella sp. TaxID=1870904 RepID=UPI0039E66854
MKLRTAATFAMIVSGLGLSVPAHAQYVMDWNAGNALIMSSIQNDSLNRERARADAERGQGKQPDRRSVSVQTRARSIVDRTFDAAIAPLHSEFRRRTTTDGKPAAAQWLTTAATSLGTELGSMAQEYRRRVRSDGEANADRWYLDRARSAGQQYATDSAHR